MGTELTEAVEDNVVLMFGGWAVLQKGTDIPSNSPFESLLPERSFVVKDRKSKSVEDG